VIGPEHKTREIRPEIDRGLRIQGPRWLDGTSILPVIVSGRAPTRSIARTVLLLRHQPGEFARGPRRQPVQRNEQEVRERVYQDRSLTCRDCSEEFVFSSGEQAFFSSKGLLNDPQRCPACRAVAKRARTAGGPREFHAAICGSCGGQAMVPFAPRNDRPVYCSSCFDKVRAGTVTETANA
jgi:CxxC-x17-CxxC domain-containing protein